MEDGKFTLTRRVNASENVVTFLNILAVVTGLASIGLAIFFNDQKATAGVIISVIAGAFTGGLLRACAVALDLLSCIAVYTYDSATETTAQTNENTSQVSAVVPA